MRTVEEVEAREGMVCLFSSISDGRWCRIRRGKAKLLLPIKNYYSNLGERGDRLMKIARMDRKRLFRAAAILFVWLIAIFWIGGKMGHSDARNYSSLLTSAAPMATTTKDGSSMSSGKHGVDEEELQKVNIESVVKDMGAIEGKLGISEWGSPVTKSRAGVPSLKLFFPKGQGVDKWQEAVVIRSFVDIPVDKSEAVYEAYEAWVKSRVRDIELKSSKDGTGIYFYGESKKERIFITGKVCTGSLKQTVHIIQYTLKDTGDNSFAGKAEEWKKLMVKVK